CEFVIAITPYFSCVMTMPRGNMVVPSATWQSTPARVHTHGVAGAILKLDRVYRWRHVFATFFPAPATVSGAQTARSPARPTRAADAPARRNRAGRHAGPWAIDAGGGAPARRAAARRAPGPPPLAAPLEHVPP